MKLYSHKPLDFGFVILCPDHATGLLKSTVNSIKTRYSGYRMTCATDDTANDADMEEMQALCPTYKGKSTFSSLINIGMKFAPAEWNIVVFAGSTVGWKMDEKYAFFIEDEKDVLFPIADRKTNFVDGTLNGLCINKKTWRTIEPMAEIGPMEVVKLMWAVEAIEKGVKFKAIANSKIC